MLENIDGRQSSDLKWNSSKWILQFKEHDKLTWSKSGKDGGC
jgi:hypothetical protein